MLSPSTVPLCFTPQTGDTITVVCPTQQHSAEKGDGDFDDVFRMAATGGDAFTIEALGLTAAAISAATALRNCRGTSTPVAIPIVLAILKLPLGALTAVLGLLLMRGEFVPGLSALDSSAQILAWAVLFGYAQQIFTRLIDQQAHTVLDKVRPQTSTETPPAAAAPAAQPG
jgi:CBS domain containing-hemolysin-like protein